MNLAVGVDLERIDRVQRLLGKHPERFLSRHYTAEEQAICAGEPGRLAGRWAAKEAVSKALGTGIGDMGFHEIEIGCDDRGAPILRLHGAASALAAERGLSAWSLSISHTEEHALAVAGAIGA